MEPKCSFAGTQTALFIADFGKIVPTNEIGAPSGSGVFVQLGKMNPHEMNFVLSLHNRNIYYNILHCTFNEKSFSIGQFSLIA